MVVGVSVFAQAVCGGAAGVVKGYIELGAAIPQCLGVFKVQLVKNGGVHLRGVGTGTDVENGVSAIGVLVYPFDEFVAVELSAENFAVEVVHLIGMFKLVDDHQVGVTGVIEAPYEGGSDEAGGSGDDENGFLRAKIGYSNWF